VGVVRSSKKSISACELMKLGVFGFGGDEDGDVGVGIFPQREKIFVGGERPDAGGIGLRTLRGSRLQSVRTSHA
jgi:hypothetical protein